jgi:hypothetical protein
MERLIKTVMARFVKMDAIKDAGFTAVDYDQSSNQLSDLFFSVQSAELGLQL